MNMRIRAITFEKANKKLSKKLTIWQNAAAVSIVGNVILAIIIAVITLT